MSSMPLVTPIERPEHISILIPTRGRVPFLEKQLATLDATTLQPEMVDVWYYVDEDDRETLEFLKARQAQDSVLKVHWVFGPATLSTGEMFNRLRAACSTHPGIFMFSSDKLLISATGWDSKVREAFDRCSDRLLFAYPRDSATNGAFGAFGFLSAEWMNITGRFFTEYFPFWYDDTWVNHVATAIDRRVVLDFDVEVQFGATMRMHNLLFWNRFYQNMVHERLDEARQLMAEICRQNPHAREEHMARFDLAASLLLGDSQANEDAHFFSMERTYSGVFLGKVELSPERLAPLRRAEENAIETLHRWLSRFVSEGQAQAVEQIATNLLYSSEAAEKLGASIEKAIESNDREFLAPALYDLSKRFPNFPRTYHLLGDGLCALGDHAKAIEVLAEAAPFFPKDVGILKRLNLCHLFRGEIEDAEKVCRAALELAPDDSDLLMSLGYLHLGRREAAPARTAFEAVVAKDDEDMDAWLALVAVAELEGDEARVQAAAERVQALSVAGIRAS